MLRPVGRRFGHEVTPMGPSERSAFDFPSRAYRATLCPRQGHAASSGDLPPWMAASARQGAWIAPGPVRQGVNNRGGKKRRHRAHVA